MEQLMTPNVLLACDLPVVLNANTGHFCGNHTRGSLMEFLFHSLPVAWAKNVIAFGKEVVEKE